MRLKTHYALSAAAALLGIVLMAVPVTWGMVVTSEDPGPVHVTLLAAGFICLFAGGAWLAVTKFRMWWTE